jgi:hypothetical protein
MHSIQAASDEHAQDYNSHKAALDGGVRGSATQLFSLSAFKKAVQCAYSLFCAGQLQVHVAIDTQQESSVLHAPLQLHKHSFASQLCQKRLWVYRC